jgi:hypothetical protein
MLSESSDDAIDYAPMDPPPATTVDMEAEPNNDEGENGSAILELDLSQLEEMARESVEEGEDVDDMITHEDLSEEVETAEELSEPTAEIGNIDEEIDLSSLFENDEDVEKLTLDFSPQKTGWLEKPQYETRQAELEAEALAAHDDSDNEEMDKLKEAFELSKQENQNLKGKLKEMASGFQQMRTFADKVKGTLSEVNLQNARLLYINKALNSDSLNGRQKDKLVEAISNSKTVEEAKVIYETLQGAVGEHRKTTRAPKSLSEAVTKRSSALLKGSEAKPTKDPNLDRMKRLAGIN